MQGGRTDSDQEKEQVLKGGRPFILRTVGSSSRILVRGVSCIRHITSTVTRWITGGKTGDREVQGQPCFSDTGS